MGHLYPEERKYHKGWAVFIIGAYGDISIVDLNFENVEDSPWFFEDVKNYMFKISDRKKYKDFVGILKFEGTYLKYKNQNCSFKGNIKKIKYN